MRKRNVLIGAALAVLLGATLYGQFAATASKEAMRQLNEPAAEHLQKPAPSFSLEALDGKTYSLDGARDKPLVVNFWASWCGPCRDEAPDLKTISEKFRNDLDFYAVNITKGDSIDNVKSFVKTYDLTMPVLLDKEGAVSGRYRVLFVPTSFLIDKTGTIREVVHVMPPNQWEKKLRDLLKPH